MYTLTLKTLHTSDVIAAFPSRQAAISMLDSIKESSLKSGEDVTYSSVLGKDVRLTVGHKTYILEG